MQPLCELSVTSTALAPSAGGLVKGESKGQSWMESEGKVGPRLAPYCPLTGTILLVLQVQNAS